MPTLRPVPKTTAVSDLNDPSVLFISGPKGKGRAEKDAADAETQRWKQVADDLTRRNRILEEQNMTLQQSSNALACNWMLHVHSYQKSLLEIAAVAGLASPIPGVSVQLQRCVLVNAYGGFRVDAAGTNLVLTAVFRTGPILRVEETAIDTVSGQMWRTAVEGEQAVSAVARQAASGSIC